MNEIKQSYKTTNINTGGPYDECISIMCFELQSEALSLFLPTSNSQSGVGEKRG